MNQQTESDNKKVTSAETKPEPPKQVENKSVKSKSSSTALIIIIIVVVVIGLGVGSYFAWRYFGAKLIDKITGKTTETTKTSSDKVKLQSVIDALLYPGSTITDQKQGEKDSSYAAELILSSSTDPSTIRNYYVKLASDNKWKVTRQGSSYEDNYYLTIESADFTAEIDVIRHIGFDTTDIYIKISGDKLSSEGIAVTIVAPTPSGTTSTTTGTTSSSSSDYIISDSNTREISRSELIKLTPWQLKVARNEIYARHGRPFVHKDLQCYFATKSWYKVDDNYDISSVSYLENRNINTIQTYEQETNSPLQSKDSGCNTNS